MLRSTSSSRAAEQLVIGTQTASQSHNSNSGANINTVAETAQQLPIYDPLSDVAKKERSRLRFAEKAIHAVPLVLVFCAVFLWFLSDSESRS